MIEVGAKGVVGAGLAEDKVGSATLCSCTVLCDTTLCSVTVVGGTTLCSDTDGAAAGGITLCSWTGLIAITEGAVARGVAAWSAARS
jgi:hypothetical protein